ncbi:MAG: TraR/DksA C4-type zinc finger protein [Paracoccaceae bacterium]
MALAPKLSLADRRAVLVTRLADLTARLEAIESELESHSNPDWEEMAIARETDEVLEASGLSGQQEIRMIEAALERIDAGDYGDCAKCGAQIPAARLDALPFTPLCRNCAEAVQKGT